MKYTEIVKEFENRGYEVALKEFTKNGVKLQGLEIGSGDIRPVLYVDEYMGLGLTVDETVDKMIEVIERSHCPEFSTDDLTDENYILDNCFLTIQRKSDEQFVKRECLDLEVVVRVLVAKDGSYRVPTSVYSGDINALLETAHSHKPDFIVEDVATTIKRLNPEMDVPFLPMWIVSTPNGHYGAVALDYPEVFKEFCDKNGWKQCYIIPSSVHELIIIENGDMIELANMISQVNDTEVRPEEVLGTHAYIYDRKSNTLTY